MTLISNVKPALIVVLTGALDKNGRIDHLTSLKLRKAAEQGDAMSRAGQTYFYVFPDSRKVNGVRVCDKMRATIETMDDNRRGVQVPESSMTLDTVDGRQSFVNSMKKSAGAVNCQYIQ